MTLIALMNDHGDCYVDPAHIVGIDGPMSKKGRVPARALKLTTGALYVHDTRANFDALRSLLPEGAIPWGPAEKVKRAKKPKPATIQP